MDAAWLRSFCKLSMRLTAMRQPSRADASPPRCQKGWIDADR